MATEVISENGNHVRRASNVEYRTPDGQNEARTITSNRNTDCYACNAPVSIGDEVLGIPGRQPINPDRRWAILCLECADKSIFEPAARKLDVGSLFGRAA